MNRILRLRDVLLITGLCKSTLYRYISEGRFPKSVRLNPDYGKRGAVGWHESVIEDWLNTLEEKNEQ